MPKHSRRRSGYLTRKITLSNIDNYHNPDFDDCGTTHFIKFAITNQRKLNSLSGRSYYLLGADGKKSGDKLYVVDPADKTLIGKTIGLRSPITCARDGHGHVCATCYGKELSEVNRNRHTGLVATYSLTEPLTQTLLSAKHLLSTKTDPITWGDKFLSIFSIDMQSISFADADHTIEFTGADINEDDEGKQYISATLFGYVPKKEGEDLRLYPNPKILDKESDFYDEETDTYTVSSRTYDEDDYVFFFDVRNNELTKSLQEILDLIESSNHGSSDDYPIEDYDALINRFSDLLIENDLDYIPMIHIEMICSMLIRDKQTGDLLDFHKERLDPYRIVRVSNSIMNAPLSVSLSFERLADQMINLDTYDKDSTSLLDSLFI